MRSTLEDFQLWMQKSGNKRKVGGERILAEPLSPRTWSRHLKKTRTILRDLGYLLYIKNPIPRRPNQWLVNPEKDVRFLIKTPCPFLLAVGFRQKSGGLQPGHAPKIIPIIIVIRPEMLGAESRRQKAGVGR